MPLERRACYRIVYPAQARPVFVRGDARYEIADVSEHGLRLAVPDDGSVGLGDDVEGVVSFRTGSEVKVEGTVVRISGGWAAVRLAARLPFAAILAEQRWLRSKFPMWGHEPMEQM